MGDKGIFCWKWTTVSLRSLANNKHTIPFQQSHEETIASHPLCDGILTSGAQAVQEPFLLSDQYNCAPTENHTSGATTIKNNKQTNIFWQTTPIEETDLSKLNKTSTSFSLLHWQLWSSYFGWIFVIVCFTHLDNLSTNTVRCRYNAVHFPQSPKWLPHSSPARASYGVSVVNLKSDSLSATVTAVPNVISW